MSGMSDRVFLPGSTVGVMGSGQLGRMFAMAARRMGYRVRTLSPEKDTPTGQIADVEVCASYRDEQAVREFARGIDVLTFEFENIPVETIQWASEHCVVRPGGTVLHVCQHRLREKEFLSGAGLPVAPFRAVEHLEGLREAVEQIGRPAVLKTAAFGYDGKGQRKVLPDSCLEEVWEAMQGQRSVLEAWIPFEREVSVVVGRGVDGQTACYPVCENVHSNHILDVTLVPGRIAPAVAVEAERLAVRVAEALGLVGVLAVEMFLLEGGGLIINELAPRPHNSGHFSFDACVTSQFEQQLRAVCGLPLGSPELLRPVAMANLLGDLWERGEPDWSGALALPEVKLHLYGKAEPRSGRKMGHLLAFGSDVEVAQALVRRARSVLGNEG